MYDIGSFFRKCIEDANQEYAEMEEEDPISYYMEPEDSLTDVYYPKPLYREPNDSDRKLACEGPESAFEYALDVDRKPHPDTRTAACKHPYYACYYAKFIDKKPTDETRAGAEADEDGYFGPAYEEWERNWNWVRMPI